MAMNAIANPAAAASAYANTAKTAQVGVPGGDAANASSFIDHMKDAANEPDFMDTVKGIVTNSIDTMRQGEKASAQAVVGKANLTDVVQAITAAEMTMQTVVAVRDKMLQAYQDIMRMPI